MAEVQRPQTTEAKQTARDADIAHGDRRLRMTREQARADSRSASAARGGGTPGADKLSNLAD